MDDALDNRQLLIKLLSPLGFEVQEATNGVEAIEIWQAWEPHLILMDMRMPVMDGYEATKRIKALTKGQATAIIAVTASSLEEERTLILSIGCDDFIRKPFQQTDIFDALHRHIGVRFIYEQPTTTPHPSEKQTAISISTALATLPPDLLADFQKALVELDVEWIQILITQVRSFNEPLAQSLFVLANNFQYEKLLNLFPDS